MSGEKIDLRVAKRKRRCRVCGTRAAVISKYKLLVCRRCFKDIAVKIGFNKFD
ncbi:MAG: 30S ribosomal protein S14 [archaeon]